MRAGTLSSDDDQPARPVEGRRPLTGLSKIEPGSGERVLERTTMGELTVQLAQQAPARRVVDRPARQRERRYAGSLPRPPGDPGIAGRLAHRERSGVGQDDA